MATLTNLFIGILFLILGLILLIFNKQLCIGFNRMSFMQAKAAAEFWRVKKPKKHEMTKAGILIRRLIIIFWSIFCIVVGISKIQGFLG